MDILGISAFYHDSAACLLRDGGILAAAAEERFSRRKNDPGFPAQAVLYCLKSAERLPDFIVFYDKPWLKFERLLETRIGTVPRGLSVFMKSVPIWMREKLFLKELIATEICRIIADSGLDHITDKAKLKRSIRFAEHHQSHAASAFYPSPFSEAAILTVDGVGEWTTTSIAHGKDNKISILQEMHFPHSLGLLYSAFTHYTGFKVNSGEYKLMGLAPYGKPSHSALIKEKLIDIKDDGSFRLNMDYFGFLDTDYMTNAKFHSLFGGLPRSPESEITEREMDIAASIQAVTEEIILKMANYAAKITGCSKLCMAGGVALNCVANRLLRQQGSFQKIWVQPAAGDCGGALGAALSFYHDEIKQIRPTPDPESDSMKNALLGPEFSTTETKAGLDELSAVYVEATNQAEMLFTVAKALQEGKIVGWHQGRMEFGPRALGNRSILANPTLENMQSTLNRKIKFRESFRPFAPAVMAEKAAEWFKKPEADPYMVFTTEVHPDKRLNLSETDKLKTGPEKLQVKRSLIPAVTHVDFSARLQTVSPEDNPLFHSLLQEFYRLSDCPVLVNTSFNVRGEPIVCTPEDSYRCFMNTDMDLLVIGNFLLWKKDQPTGRSNKPPTEAKAAHKRKLPPANQSVGIKTLKLFGLSWTIILTLINLWLYRKQLNGILSFSATINILLPIIILIWPELLKKPQIIFTLFGEYMGMLIAKIVLFLLFWLVFLPLGLFFRLTGKDALQRSINKKAVSYWQERKRQPETMTLQF
jgi:carbamoyltransferase